MSRIFPGRAPEGRELLHCMLGGVRWPEVTSQPDDVLRARLLEDLDRSLGLVGEPRSLCVRRFERAIPQPGTDHPRRITDVERRLATLRGLALAGSFVGGVSVADSLASGVRAASQVVEAAA